MSPFQFVSAFLLFFILPISSFAKEDAMLLNVGATAPDFTLVNADGTTVSLHDFAGKNPVVLVFYPGDQTPGCTKQLCAIRDDYSQFQEKNVQVFGINHADKASHKKFIEKEKYPFTLLVDENNVVAKQYGCESGPAVKRTVYAIGIDGKILFAKQGMPDDAEILAAIP